MLLAAAAPRVFLADPARNAEAILSCARRAEKQGAGLLLLPELCLTGHCGHLLPHGWLRTRAEAALTQLAAQTAALRCALVVSFPGEAGRPEYALLQNGMTTQLDAGRQLRLTLREGDGARAQTLCLLDSLQPLPEADIALYPFAQPWTVGSRDWLCNTAQFYTREAHGTLVCAGAGYGESTTDAAWKGISLVCRSGRALAYEEAYACADTAATAQLTVPDFSINNPEESQPWLPLDAAARAMTLEEILCIQSSALRGRMEAVGIQQLVLNLSGGLDSTLALLVATRALDELGLPRENLTCLVLPGFGTGPRTLGNALALAEAFHVRCREISIVADVTAHLAHIGHGGAQDVTYENAQARERTQIALDIANMAGGMMLGTGNMSEAALGFATFGGDTVAQYNLNIGIPKTIVRELVLYEARKLRGEAGALLRDVHATPVSPELIPGQITEDIVGPYALHDFFLYWWLVGGEDDAVIEARAKRAFAGVFTPDEIRHWLSVFIRRFFAAQFKRSCAVDGPAPLSLSLSPRTGWRMPSDVPLSGLSEERREPS